MKMLPRVLVAAALICCRGDSDEAFTQDFGESFDEFMTAGRNDFFVLEPGHVIELQDGRERVLITVLADTELVDKVGTRVVEERETIDGQLREVSRNFFAFNGRSGGVYYFGEDADIYEAGRITSHEGSWRSGQNGARYGLMIPATPLLGARYQQEIAPGVAMDRAEIVALDDTLTTPAGQFDRLVRVEETTPLEPGVREYKWYAPGQGLVRDGSLRLVKLQVNRD